MMTLINQIIFNKETIGEITYDVEGAFNLQSMEF
jgi:hypothetical protein